MERKLNKKGLRDEYLHHSIKEIGYYLGDITKLRDYSKDLKSIIKFYVERETDSESRKKGKKLINKTYRLMMDSMIIGLQFKNEILPEIKKEVHSVESNMDKDKAKEIKEEMKRISRELKELTMEIEEFLKELED